LNATIFNIQRYAVHDGPGIRTTVFLKGCPLSCWWCHNPEGLSLERQIIIWPERCIRCGDCVEICPAAAAALQAPGPVIDQARCTLCGRCTETCPSEALEMAGRDISLEELLQEVEKDRVFYEQSGGGVTFGGGEPLLQYDFLKAAAEASAQRGIHTVVDTSGYADGEKLLALSRHVDLFLYDLKHMDNNRHREITGVGNTLILRNLERLVKAGQAVVARFPLIPGINDGDHVKRLGAYLASVPVTTVHVLPYHNIAQGKYQRLAYNDAMQGFQPPSEAMIEEAAAVLVSYGLETKRGG